MPQKDFIKQSVGCTWGQGQLSAQVSRTALRSISFNRTRALIRRSRWQKPGKFQWRCKDDDRRLVTEVAERRRQPGTALMLFPWCLWTLRPQSANRSLISLPNFYLRPSDVEALCKDGRGGFQCLRSNLAGHSRPYPSVGVLLCVTDP